MTQNATSAFFALDYILNIYRWKNDSPVLSIHPWVLLGYSPVPFSAQLRVIYFFSAKGLVDLVSMLPVFFINL